jgi:hypothetical protein
MQKDTPKSASKNITQKAKIPVDTPAHTYPPTLVGVIQHRRPMVKARLQNFFPRQLPSLLRSIQHHELPA